MTRDEALAWLAQTEKNMLTSDCFLICSRQSNIYLVTDPLHARRLSDDELRQWLLKCDWVKG